ncbi:hypothetical protein FA15DRAFT_622634 [Coprinopsis marcescibilis]|uniref:non-specific serine/threonine protein kinase n=1 Tax=Coprinopsis marcescibilis TaxID=230819 RepID=A0A5C3KP70_COPMA|nr:hypothetical protein FA15DRAFT_622634 [Coprinopsis marcescibilis]
MLSTRTKQINAYGKRGKRVVDVTVSAETKLGPNGLVSIFDDLPPPPAIAGLTSRMKKRENQIPKSSPKVVGKQRKKRPSLTASPIKKPNRVAQLIQESRRPTKGDSLQQIKPKAKLADPSDTYEPTTTGTAMDSPFRMPLATFSPNVPGSPGLPAHMRLGQQRVPSGKLGKAVPFKLGKSVKTVDVDITVLDDAGEVVTKERRVSRTGIQINNEISKPRLTKVASRPAAQVNCDSESEVVRQPKKPKRALKKQPTVVLSDDSESEPEVKARPPPPRKPTTKPLSRLPTVEVLIPPAPYPIAPIAKEPSETRITTPATPPKPKPRPLHRPAFHRPPSPIARPRQLTPIRGNRSKGLFDPPSPPSPTTPTDLDFSLDFSELSLDLGYNDTPTAAEHDIPEYLRPLLEECHQEVCGPHDFSSFIESFPFDPILQEGRPNGHELEFRKIGEASYSEVFGIGNVVLKVIPLRDESTKTTAAQMTLAPRSNAVGEQEGPAPSDAQDVRKEIIVTRAMGEVYGGFVKFLKTYIVRGKYPQLLLQLWDEYNDKKGSDSIRPDSFKLSQVYAIIVLPNGGPDLETYSFVNASKVGWKQACSIFWQVAKSLAHAERLVSFEHRDLHWGQILVKNVASQRPRLQAVNLNQAAKPKTPRVFMDDASHGVQATVIDLGLSRMDAGDGSDGFRAHWTPFDEEVFMGQGDYQFEIYRMMRDLTNGDWGDYHPMTNVMWLHYLCTQLLTGKGLRAPTARKTKEAPVSGPDVAFSERDCYDSLVDIEQWLGGVLTEAFPAQAKAITKAKGRRKTIAPVNRAALRQGPGCAGEVVEYAIKKGWVRAIKLF